MTSRPDLLSLTTDDLTVLGNRGLVKRAQRELTTDLTATWTVHDDGGLVCEWSDAITCTLPAQSSGSSQNTIGSCTCPATTLCRHLIRTILAYQKQFADAEKTQQAEASVSSQSQAVEATTSAPTPIDSAVPATVSESAPVDSSETVSASVASQRAWNPGSITDEAIATTFTKRQLSRIKTQWSGGQVVEVMTGAKPTARLHTVAHTVRFLVPDDIRYTYCDCADESPCSHVPLAIWAFRQLPSGQASGIIVQDSDDQDEVTPVELLDSLETMLVQLVEFGLAGLSEGTLIQLRQVEDTLRQAQLIWLADGVADVVLQCDRYRTQDARFCPHTLVRLIGELCIRSDALRHYTGVIPRLFIQGSAGDRPTTLGASRLIGLGCGVDPHPTSVTLNAYLQDADTGTVMVMSQEIATPNTSDNLPPVFWKLAQKSAFKQTSFATLGQGQLLLKSGKRAPNLQLKLGRSPAAVNPQTYRWEKLRPPLLVESFSELHHHLDLLPPAALRSRRATETLHILAVDRVEDVTFSVIDQAVLATLYDTQGQSAQLYFPYSDRAQPGTEALLTHLTHSTPQFVAGTVTLANQTLRIQPISLIFDQEGQRVMLQPWIHAPSIQRLPTVESNVESEPISANAPPLSVLHPIQDYLQEVEEAIAQTLLLGATRSEMRLWQSLAARGKDLGFTLVLDPIQQLADHLQNRQQTLDWTAKPVAELLLTLMVVVQV